MARVNRLDAGMLAISRLGGRVVVDYRRKRVTFGIKPLALNEAERWQMVTLERRMVDLARWVARWEGWTVGPIPADLRRRLNGSGK